uniref:Bm13528 n=1 Tax=Brugia malayi TaxID=6279 RepID=A0A1I9G496_BRUMA|nr:Bm13528 [Brugia malayi]
MAYRLVGKFAARNLSLTNFNCEVTEKLFSVASKTQQKQSIVILSDFNEMRAV